MTRYRVAHPREFDANLRTRWAEIQAADPIFASPYFHPAFTECVAAVREDVRITVLEDANTIVGFFPHQRARFGRGKPVGGALSDYHGVVCAEGAEWTPRELLSGSGLNVFDFDHLVVGKRELHAVQTTKFESPIMELSGGYDRYASGRQKAGSKLISKTDGLARKLVRDHAQWRFELHSTDRDVLRILMRWKSEQYRKSGLRDVFAVPWIPDLMELLVSRSEPGFAGLLSVLWLQDRPIAIHMGMRSAKVWHYWFPSFDRNFEKYSPGNILLLQMAMAAASIGLQVIDLGKGDASYKSRLANGAAPLLEGRFEIPSFYNCVRSLRRGAEDLMERNRLARAIGIPLRALRRLDRIRKYD